MIRHVIMILYLSFEDTDNVATKKRTVKYSAPPKVNSFALNYLF